MFRSTMRVTIKALLAFAALILTTSHALSTKTRGWDARYQDLVAFKEKYGHTSVPQPRTRDFHPDFNELAAFCRNCRMHYQYQKKPSTRHKSFLTPDRIGRLEALGFEFNVQRANWRQRYEELKAFYHEHNHTNVPALYPDNPALAAWVTSQRQKYKTFQSHASSRSSSRERREEWQHQVQLLEAIGFAWQPQQAAWWRRYQELRLFYQQHGHADLTVTNAPSEELLRWYKHQRRLCREYSLAVQIEGEECASVPGLDAKRLQALHEIEVF